MPCKTNVFVAVLLLSLSACTQPGDNEKVSSPEPEQLAAAAHGATSELKFSAPPEWIAEAPASSMRQAQYRLPRAQGDSEDGELVVFYFQGEGGSVQANLDRWSGQFTRADGSPASDAAQVTRREIAGIPVTILDITGTYAASMGPMMGQTQNKPDFRMIAAVAETDGGPWFFRLTGPEKTTAKWEAGFQAFLQTLRTNP